MDVVIIIPAYNPDEKFIHFLKLLRKNMAVSFYPTALILGKVVHIKQDLIFTYLNRELFIQKP